MIRKSRAGVAKLWHAVAPHLLASCFYKLKLCWSITILIDVESFSVFTRNSRILIGFSAETA